MLSQRVGREVHSFRFAVGILGNVFRLCLREYSGDGLQSEHVTGKSTLTRSSPQMLIHDQLGCCGSCAAWPGALAEGQCQSLGKLRSGRMVARILERARDSSQTKAAFHLLGPHVQDWVSVPECQLAGHH